MITSDLALSVLDMIILYNLKLDAVRGTDLENSLYAFGQSEEIASSMYNDNIID